VEEHLRTCVRCGMEFDTYAKIKEALRETSQQSPFMIEDEVAIERLRRFANQLVGPNDGGRD
jgi:predicted anti-sigma-YlaC factor YlaD